MKANLLKDYFGKNNVLSPDLYEAPIMALNQLTKIIESWTNLLLIGSSLGGFYSNVLSTRFKLKQVLINPSIEPWVTLPKTEPTYPREYISQLHDIDKSIEGYSNFQNTTLFLAKDDEVLDYKVAKSKFEGAKMYIFETGGHRFEEMFKDECLPLIKALLTKNNYL